MELNFLPDKIIDVLKNINVDKLYELRFRVGYPIKASYLNKNYYLSDYGLTRIIDEALTCSLEDIEEILLKATEHSLYAYNEKLKNGFIPLENGARIGVAGECVVDKNEIITIKNVKSLNVRIPHDIFGCADKIFCYVYDGKIKNTLLISPPFCGKTTILKDIVRKLDNIDGISILVIDERGEFSLTCGQNTDIIKYSDKTYAFNCGIRAMSPDIVITDELCGREDWKCVFRASNSGVKVIASCHAAKIEDVINQEFFIKNIFDRYVILKEKSEGFGVLKEVYDGKLNKL